MQERIYTIPLNESFAQGEGCPFCRLYHKLERDTTEYILGAAMMEPAVRVQTNARGFCARHYEALLAAGNRLPLSLLLQSFLFTNKERLAAARGKPEKGVGLLLDIAGACYACERVALFMSHVIRNAVYLYRTEPDFAAKFVAAEDICLTHMTQFLAAAQKDMPKKHFAALYALCAEKIDRAMAQHHTAVTAFCNSYDYKAAKTPLSGRVREAIEYAIAFLRGNSGTA